MTSRLFPALLSLAFVTACSDGGDSINIDPQYSVDPETIDVSQADYCDITQPANCLFPFPSNFFTRQDDSTATGRRVNFDARAMPVNAQGTPIDPTEYNRGDGFSIGTTLLTHIAGVDLDASGAAPITDMGLSLDSAAPVQIIDAQSCERQLVWTEIDQIPGDGEQRAMMIRVGRSLQNNARYLVVLQNLLDSAGNRIEPEDAFKIYQEDIPSDVPELEARRGQFNALFTDLEQCGIERDRLYLAWDFTTASTRNTTERALHMRDTSLSDLSGTAPAVTIISVVDSSPDEDENLGRVITGTITVPNFMDNALASPGSRLNYTSDDPDALPAQFNGDGTVEVEFLCAIPHVAFADAVDGDTDTRAVVVGHGVFGTRNTVTRVGGVAEQTNALFCGMDWWGMSQNDVPSAIGQLSDLSRFPEMPDRLQQAFLNKIFLSETMVNPAGFQSLPEFQDDDGNVLYRGDSVQYNGISMGSVYGGSLSALSPHFDYSVLDLAGMNWAIIIRRSTLWSTYAAVYEPAYPDSLVQPLGLSLAQMAWDRADSNGYANHITEDPLPGSKLSRVLIQSPIGDQILTETAAELMQRSLDTSRHTPSNVEGRHIAVEPYLDIATISAYPFEGNAVMHWDSGPFPINGRDGTPLQRSDNLLQTQGFDTHGMPVGQPGNWEQKATFWRSGQVIDVCGPEPCYGDGYDGTPGVYDPANAPEE